MTAETPSTRLADSTLRKLLILDLNGTLLYRSPHVSRARSYQRHNLRPVHPRPYMSSFVSYLFHPHTLQWLDTMIWSSAQPHSVADMVGKCFGDSQASLLAIWARDTLGLSQAQYSQKSQTTKDLSKPWAFFQEAHPGIPLRHHSALSTILVDDSPRKARMQPWNHLCVREYTSILRRIDIAVAARAQGRSNDVVEEVRGKKRKRDKMRQARMESTQEYIPPPPNPTTRPNDFEAVHTEIHPPLLPEGVFAPNDQYYDSVLLAVIGILEAMKLESNVSGWMKSGGLLQVPPTPDAARTSAEGSTNKRQRFSPGDILPSLDVPPPPASSSYIPDSVGEGGESEDPSTHDSSKPLWYENPTVFAYWISRGIGALDDLGIPIENGVKL
ncbi:hypothetical protein BD779DRAFT_694928 [Infundibulicybe gibba]|nr:hypothetical protein BD779DRAFT_694928 [Infundibulicybe gibba]